MSVLKIQTKITGLLILYFFIALAAISSTLYASWLLEGGAAAINDAGRERMRLYNIAFMIALQEGQLPQPREAANLWVEIEVEIKQFEETLNTILEHETPRSLSLFMDDNVRNQLHKLQQNWHNEIKPGLRRAIEAARHEEHDKGVAVFRPVLKEFIGSVDLLVGLVVSNNTRVATLLRFFQVGLTGLALIGTALLIRLFSVLVVRPITYLKESIQRMGKGEFDVRMQVAGPGDFGELANGFNKMAVQLQESNTTLKQRIEEKSHSIEIKNRELMALYEVAAFLNSSTATEPLCGNVLEKLSALTGACDGVVRLVDSKGRQIKVVASSGISEAFLSGETCLSVGDCLCGEVARDGIAVSSNFSTPMARPMLHACKRDGFQAVVAIPIRSKKQVLGMINLFFDTPRILPQSEIQLLESVGQHLGIAIENQRLVAREKEMAVSEERNLLAQELHDSIAQSLAYLNIQVQLLHQDMQYGRTTEALQGLEQIREGVQESYDDVRELLVHFRTHIGNADFQTAVGSALEKFKGQTGIHTALTHRGVMPDMPPEHVFQSMHIVQESLSNVRKHARASRVDVELCSDDQGVEVSIRDDGVGFDVASDAGVNHVGLSIMRERAHRIGAKLTLESDLGQGTRVHLGLPNARNLRA